MWASVHTGTLREAHSPEGDLCLSITVYPPPSESEVLEGASVQASRRLSGPPAAFTPAVHPQLLVSASAPSKVQGSSSVCLPQVPRPEAVVLAGPGGYSFLLRVGPPLGWRLQPWGSTQPSRPDPRALPESLLQLLSHAQVPAGQGTLLL